MAEYFRDQGYNVVVIVDTLTRWAMADQEVSCLEGNVSRPDFKSVVPKLKKLLERFAPLCFSSTNELLELGKSTALAEMIEEAR